MFSEISRHLLDIFHNSAEAKATLVSIRIYSNKCAGLLTVEVADDGTGIAKSDLESVTDPFFTSRQNRITGLGIPFFKQSAECTGGTFEILSNCGNGVFIRAVYSTDHADCPVIGNLRDDLAAAVLNENAPDISFFFQSDGKRLEFDTRKMKEEGPADNYSLWYRIRRYFEENSEFLNIDSYGRKIFRYKEEKMKVIIAAAGTGGHINPGIAIANKIKSEQPNSEIIFIGTERGLENDLVPRAGYTLKTIEAYGFSRKVSIENIKEMYKTFASIKEAKKIIEEFKPDVVIGTGGYICVPVMLAAKSKKIPTVLHESNAFPGIAVKMLSKKVNLILVGFEDAIKKLPKAKKIVVTGTPTKLRKMELTTEEKKKITKEFGFKDYEPRVLIFGGSQGAQSINDSMIEIITEKSNRGYQIIWAAGPSQYDIIKEKLNEKGIDINNIQSVRVVPYIYNMQEIMNYADLVVSRSGAMTVTEVALLGKPAIFIPFPHATENHQEYNARELVNNQAADMILEKDLTGEKLISTIDAIINDESRLNVLKENAQKLGKPNALEDMYRVIVDMLGK